MLLRGERALTRDECVLHVGEVLLVKKVQERRLGLLRVLKQRES